MGELMDLLISCAGNVASTLFSGTIEEARYSYFFNNYLEDHRKEKGALIAKRDSVQNRAENARRQTKEIDPVVINWLEETNSLIGKAERLEEKANCKKSCCLGFCPNWFRRYFLGKQLVSQKDDIVKQNNEGTNFAQDEVLAPLPGMEYYTSENFIFFESTKLAFDELLKVLKDEKVSMIGLHGIGGCGKTTLAKQVGKEAEKLFDKVVFATVFSTIDVRRIQAQIADSLGLKLEEEDVSGRARRLWMRIKNEKKILIILDDVWEKLDWEAIGIQSDDKCKVLLTTRRQQVCNLMDCHAIIHLNLLNKKDSWSLFQYYARITDKTPDGVRRLAQQISEKCDGLPIAIVVVASSLKGKAKEEWEETWETIRNSEPLNVEAGLENPYACLKLSYDKLKDRKAELLFSLCSTFPEDFEVTIQHLTLFVKGLGLFGEVDSYERLRGQVIVAKNKLKDSCLLLQDKYWTGEEFVKMHDFVRDVALWIAKEECKLITVLERNQNVGEGKANVHDSVTKYLCCEAFPSHLNYPKLEFLFVSTDLDHVTIRSAFFEGLKELKVLALYNKGNQRPLVIRAIQTLTNLCCIYLSRWKVDESTYSFILSLKRLKSLVLLDCLIDMKEIAPMNEVTTRYTIPENLEVLIMTYCVGFKCVPFFGMPNLFKLKVIQIINCHQLENFLTPIIAQSLKQLEELQITYCNAIRHIFGQHSNKDQIQDEFQIIELPALKVLKLVWLGSLVSICPDNYYLRCPSLVEFLSEWSPKFIGMIPQHGSEFTGFGIQTKSLQNLQRLYIRKCNIRYICSTYTADSLPLLQELEVRNCRKLEQIFMDNEHPDKPSSGSDNDGDHIQEELQIKLPALKVLKLEDLDNLMSICPENSYLWCPSLREIDLQVCKRLTGIRLQHDSELTGFGIQIRSLVNLQRLYIRGCNIRYIFSTCTANSLPLLEELDVEHCNELEEIFVDNYHRHKQNSGSFNLCRLQKLVVIYCSKLKSLFPVSIAEGLNSLEKLKIRKCKSLECLFPTTCAWGQEKLSKIEIVGAEKLKYVFGQCDDEVSSPHDNAPLKLPALEVLHLEEMPALIRICPKNCYATCPSLHELSLLKVQLRTAISMIFGEYRFLKEQFVQNLRTLQIWNEEKLETIYDLEEVSIDRQQVSSGLTNLILGNLPKLKSIWMGPKHILTLQNLENVNIGGCANLKTIFPSSISGRLPHLKILTILNCEALEEIIEEDEENHNSPTIANCPQLCCPLMRLKKPMKKGEAVDVCFPLLKLLVVGKCNKLKHVLPFSTLYEFPKLQYIIIFQSSNIEKVIAGKASVTEEGKDVGLPQLKLLMLMNLPMLATVCQGIGLHKVAYCVVHACEQLSLTPTITFEDFERNYHEKFEDLDMDTRSRLFFYIEYVIQEAALADYRT